jgi:1-phosphatidylinositol phosphodiesterase
MIWLIPGFVPLVGVVIGYAVENIVEEKVKEVIRVISVPIINHKNWMKNLKDETILSTISIPGTHNSAAYGHIMIGVNCQQMNLKTQLEAGIRSLDIRVVMSDNQFYIYHGEFYLEFSFSDILNICKTFLEENKTEVIIMGITYENKDSKDEDQKKKIKNCFMGYTNDYKDILYLENKIPKVGQVRGKIVSLNVIYFLKILL